MATQTFGLQVAVLAGIALLMTVGVYGLVAGIVKLDDAGLALAGRPEGGFNNALRAFGRGIVGVSPWLMRFLSVAGTIAMFLVGGSILAHGMPLLHHGAEAFVAWLGTLPGIAGLLSALGSTLFDLVVGVVAGTIIVASVSVVRRFVPARGGGAGA